MCLIELSWVWLSLQISLGLRSCSRSLRSSDRHRNSSTITCSGHLTFSSTGHGSNRKTRKHRMWFLGSWGKGGAGSTGSAVWAEWFLENHLQVWFKKIISHKQSRGSPGDAFLFSHSQTLPASRLSPWGLLAHKSLLFEDCQGIKTESPAR